MSISGTPRKVMLTYDDYQYLPNDGKRYEIVEGDLYVSPAPSPLHQTVSRRLQYALMGALEQTGIAVVFDAPIDVILADVTVVQPDIAVVRNTRKHLITRRAIEGAPDLVIEILSPSTSGQDRHLKRTTYAKHQVREYWIVDPDRGMVELLRLEPEGNYALYQRFDRASTLMSPEFPAVAIEMWKVFAEI